MQFVCFPEPEAAPRPFENVERIRYQSDQTRNKFLSTFLICEIEDFGESLFLFVLIRGTKVNLSGVWSMCSL